MNIWLILAERLETIRLLRAREVEHLIFDEYDQARIER